MDIIDLLRHVAHHAAEGGRHLEKEILLGAISEIKGLRRNVEGLEEELATFIEGEEVIMGPGRAEKWGQDDE